MPLVGSSFRESARLSVDTPVVRAETTTPSDFPERRRRASTIAGALAMVAAIVAIEWYSELAFSLGVLYVLPLLVVGTVLSRLQMLVAAVLSALLRGQFTGDLPLIEYWLRFLMATLAYAGSGLLVVEISERRRRLLRAYHRLEEEKSARSRAEDSLRLLAESSPAAIVTLDSRADVIGANRA
ncbi:MAG: hypothetical protein AB7N65_23605, partial [Vicinamibacterales bacterium]